jgi:long-subunit fatty acid transport protein
MNRVIHIAAVALVACGTGLVACKTSLANGVIMDGVSARPIGRGGTNLAFSDNGSILHDNPASIVTIEVDNMLEAGVTGFITEFRYSDPQNPDASISEFYAMPEFSYIRRSREYENVAYGIGIFAPAGFGAQWRDLEGPPPIGGDQLYKSFACLTRILPGVAYQATDRLSIGATLGVGVMIADLEGPYILQSSLPGFPTIIDMDAGGAALSWSVGLNYKLTDATTVGVAYQNENRFNARGDTHVTIPGLGEADYRSRLGITWPQSVGIGVRHELNCCHILSADFVWYDWSSAFDSFGLRLYDGTAGFPPTLTESFPLNWRDSLSTRLGYEMRLRGCRTLRFGYVHNRNPLPANTMTPYIQAALENAFSCGYGTQFFGWNTDFAYMYSFGPTVIETQSAFIGGDFDNSTHRDRTHALVLTIMRSW